MPQGRGAARRRLRLSKQKAEIVSIARRYRDYFPEDVRKDPRRVLKMEQAKYMETLELIERHQRMKARLEAPPQQG